MDFPLTAAGGDVISVDCRGRWWYRGNEIIHPEVLALFRRSVTRDPDTGVYRIDYRGTRAEIEVACTALFVQDVVFDREPGAAGGVTAITVKLDDGTAETIDPVGVYLDGDGVLNVMVRGGALPARCLPAAHFRLAELLEEGKDGFLLVCGGRSRPLAK
ncbi:MAG: DUF1285 domain-containing protein [Deltaproteobacteria bacterium]|nr:DUF1285 domain-containing protein [Candidatus Anaeroferrophillacea bacterium]